MGLLVYFTLWFSLVYVFLINITIKYHVSFVYYSDSGGNTLEYGSFVNE